MSDKEITDNEINKIISNNEIKLTSEEVNLISKNIIHNKEWKHHLQYSPKEFFNNKININENLFNDLEIFISYNHDENDTVYKQINHTKTKLGDHYYRELLSNPTKNIEILSNRQKLVRNLLENPEKHQKIIKLLNQLNQCQTDGLWMWKDQTQEFDQILQMLYFKNHYLQVFNTSEWFLKIYNYFQILFIPIYGLIAPILFFIVPYIIVRVFFGFKIPLKFYFNIIKHTFFGNSMTANLFGNSKLVSLMQLIYQGISLFLYGYGIYNSFKMAMTLNKIINMIHEKVNNLAKFIKTAYELYQEAKGILDLEPLTVSYLELWDNLFEKSPHLLSDKGKILRTFFLLINGKDKLIPLLQMTGFIDTINSISYLYTINNTQKQTQNTVEQFDVVVGLDGKETKENKKEILKSYCFPEYLVGSDEPRLVCDNIWNPFLNSLKAVKNDFELGKENPNNILITGPNASGKSTFIKSVVLGVLMSQTISISPCNVMSITPFELLNTYLNIPDAKGRESLFEAEMYRARNHIDQVYKLKPTDFSLVIMDEIFNSTNYEEGVAGAYIIGKELGNIKNSLTIITTHFNYLTKLEKTKMFKNYKFEVEKIDKQIIKSYKIKEGVSKQYLALDLLEKNGYNPEMITEARKIFNELVELTNPHFLEKSVSKKHFLEKSVSKKHFLEKSVIKKHKNSKNLKEEKKVNEIPLENLEMPLEKS